MAKHFPASPPKAFPPLFPIALFLYYVIFLNLILFVFNLIPVPAARRQPHPPPLPSLQGRCSIYDRIGVFARMIFIMLLGGGFIFRDLLSIHVCNPFSSPYSAMYSVNSPGSIPRTDLLCESLAA